ncbi:MAG: hypothetical protein ACYC4D_04595 [Thermoleophilia bacterium]
MKNKPLLLWGLGAGVIAVVVFIVGYAFVWPADDGEGCGLMKDGRRSTLHGGMMDGGRGLWDHGMMDEEDGLWDHGMMDEEDGCGISGIMEDMHRGSMMGSSFDDRTTTADMTISADDARSRAQKYTDIQYPGSTAGNPDLFYGYHTVDITKDGRVLAMISVNGYSGQVWLHSLNGTHLGGKTH